MICTFHKCYEMNYSINSWKLIIIANDIKAKEKVLKTKLKTRSRFSNDSKTGLAWRDDRTSGWQLDWSGNDFMPRLMSTPAGVVVVVLLQAGVTRCRGFRVHDAGAGGSQLHGNGVASAGWRTRFVCLSSKCCLCAFFRVHCLLHALLQRALWCVRYRSHCNALQWLLWTTHIISKGALWPPGHAL